MTAPGARALGGMRAVFAEFERDILRDRVKAGIAQAREERRPHGRPSTMPQHAVEIETLFARGIRKRQIAARLRIRPQGKIGVKIGLSRRLSTNDGP